MPTDLESDIARLPRLALTALVVRAARRIAPLVVPTADKYGPEAWEWFNVTAATIRAAEAFARGGDVSRFTLDVAAELPRAAANALAMTVRSHGPSASVEQAELAFAAAAFAADVARAGSAARAVKLAAQAVGVAEVSAYPVVALLSFDVAVLTGMDLGPADGLGAAVDPSETGPLGELWPTGEPDGWSSAWAELKVRAVVLPFGFC
jgi:hypothetical protein